MPEITPAEQPFPAISLFFFAANEAAGPRPEQSMSPCNIYVGDRIASQPVTSH
jgi:hypothetical protein